MIGPRRKKELKKKRSQTDVERGFVQGGDSPMEDRLKQKHAAAMWTS